MIAQFVDSNHRRFDVDGVRVSSLGQAFEKASLPRNWSSQNLDFWSVVGRSAPFNHFLESSNPIGYN